jgi:hypothetical protein
VVNGSTLQNYYLPIAGGILAVYNASGLQYYRHADWLGSSRRVAHNCLRLAIVGFQELQ